MDLFALGVIIFILVMKSYPIDEYASEKDPKYKYLAAKDY